MLATASSQHRPDNAMFAGKLHKNAASLIAFLDMNAEFLKLHILEAVQDLKINFYMQKFSLF